MELAKTTFKSRHVRRLNGVDYKNVGFYNSITSI